MSTPDVARLTAALATVHDPEIKRPITELGMVDHLEIDDAGLVRVTVLLTVSGCPLKDTIDRDVRRALGEVDGVTGVELTLGTMTDEQRAELQQTLRGGQAPKEIPFSQPGSLTKVFAIASGKGGVGKSSVTVNLALALAKAGRSVGIVDADVYGHSVPAMLGIADHRPTQVESMIMPVPTPSGVSVISIGMLKPRRDQVVAWTCSCWISRRVPATWRSRSGSTSRAPRSSWSPHRRRRLPRSRSGRGRWPRCCISAWSASSRT
jgi:ATP-binding protein involved in chromosome partitioning